MSKEIKITIVIDDEKTNTKKAGDSGHFLTLTHDISMTVMSTLRRANLLRGSFCGGRGDCGRCRIRFLEGQTIPVALERKALLPDELREGYRLACLAKPKDDCVIKLDFPKEDQIAILSEMIEPSENIDFSGLQEKQTEKRKADVRESLAQNAGNCIAAVDLGTTTIAIQLLSLSAGRVVDTYCEMNPQRQYGADVLSRIKAATEGHGEDLQRMVRGVLERALVRFGDRVGCICIAGNTTMEHLFMGHDVSGLGVSPFIPVEIGIQEGRFLNIPCYLTPGITAFVGGDIVAGLYALGLMDENQAVDAGRVFIDLGTNGEMAVTGGKRMIVTATAAGPAFEGGLSSSVIGTDMVAAVAELLEHGIIDETGLMQEPYFEKGVSICKEKGLLPGNRTGKDKAAIYLRGSDIRNFQMAKAAVRAGVEILWEKIGKIPINKVYLAGGFGYYLNVEAAFRIGLLPEAFRGKVQAVGNTSLAGAYRMGKALFEKTLDREKLKEKLAAVESVNLAEQEGFERLYLDYMNFT